MHKITTFIYSQAMFQQPLLHSSEQLLFAAK